MLSMQGAWPRSYPRFFWMGTQTWTQLSLLSSEKSVPSGAQPRGSKSPPPKPSRELTVGQKDVHQKRLLMDSLTRGTAQANAQYTSFTRLHAEHQWSSTSWMAGAHLYSKILAEALTSCSATCVKRVVLVQAGDCIPAALCTGACCARRPLCATAHSGNGWSVAEGLATPIQDARRYCSAGFHHRSACSVAHPAATPGAVAAAARAALRYHTGGT